MTYLEDYVEDLKNVVNQIPLGLIDDIIKLLNRVRLEGKKIFVMGNGGSASTASHFVCDLGKNTRKPGLPHFRVIGLTDNMAAFSAYANDEGYQNVFRQQLDNLLDPGDLVIAISASGNSPNVLEAIELANSREAITIGFTGMTGGKLVKLAHLAVHVPSMRMPQVEDVHLILQHMICSAIADQDLTSALAPLPVYTHDRRDIYLNQFNFLIGKNINIQPHPAGQFVLENLPDFDRNILDSASYARLLPNILKMVVKSVDAASGSIVVLDEHGQVIDSARAYDDKIELGASNNFNKVIQDGLAGWVIENKQPALVSDTCDDPRWLPRNGEYGDEAERSAICVPLITNDRVIGVVTLTRKASNGFSDGDLFMLTTLTLAISYSILLSQAKK